MHTLHKSCLNGQACYACVIVTAVLVTLLAVTLYHPTSLRANELPKVIEMTRVNVSPNSSFIKSNRAYMQTRDFGGMVLFVDFNDNGVRRPLETNTLTSTRTLTDVEFASEKTLLRGNMPANWTDAFVGIHCSSGKGKINWFGSGAYWNKLLYNLGAVARFARDIGTRGIMLDCEAYQNAFHWHYTALEAAYPGNTSGTALQKREQWAAKVKEKGTQMMQRMTQEYGADFRLMFRIGLSGVRAFEIDRKEPLSVPGTNDYELVPAFINGLLEGISGNAVIVEPVSGFAFKLGYPLQSAFNLIWNRMKPVDGDVVNNTEYVEPQNVDAYNSKYKIAYMVHMDDSDNPSPTYYDGTVWSNTNLSANTYTPSTLETWLEQCKDPKYNTNVYCVIWKGQWKETNLPNWWRRGGINQQYVEVVNDLF